MVVTFVLKSKIYIATIQINIIDYCKWVVINYLFCEKITQFTHLYNNIDLKNIDTNNPI